MEEKKIKILFVLKKRSSYGISYGLKTSCSLISKELETKNIECKIAEVIDSHGVDKEIYDYKPTHVVLEAIWCDPIKLPALFKLHPNVKKWTVRLHSRAPFISTEALAFDYLKRYQKICELYPKFNISTNHSEMKKEITYTLNLIPDYLPNIYPFKETHYNKDKHPEILDISSFGALRIQKNTLIQAIAAIRFADLNNKKLRFHININQGEKSEQSILKNLASIFDSPKHKLVTHPWSNHADFIKLVKTMDICMGVSNTETFNITLADGIVNNIPVVASEVVEIVNKAFHANPNKVDDIVNKLGLAYDCRQFNLQDLNKECLSKFNVIATEKWLEWLK